MLAQSPFMWGNRPAQIYYLHRDADGSIGGAALHCSRPSILHAMRVIYIARQNSCNNRRSSCRNLILRSLRPPSMTPGGGTTYEAHEASRPEEGAVVAQRRPRDRRTGPTDDDEIGRRSCSGATGARRARGQHGARSKPTSSNAARGDHILATVNIGEFGDRRDLRTEIRPSRQSAHMNTSARIHGISTGSNGQPADPDRR